MEFDEGIREVDEAVTEAVKLIKANHAGANPNEARKFLRKTGEALEAEKFEEAVGLAKKAQLAAKPTTGYLLSKAKELAAGAEKSFGSRGYEKAIELWKNALAEYVRAEDLAKERDESEIVEKMRVVEGTINDNISKTEIAIDNREILNLVEVGNSSLDMANRFFEDKKFDESKGAYEKARRIFKEALGLAEKRGFDADAGKIKDALGSIETSIEAALLSKGDDMLKSAEERFKENNFAEAEGEFSKTIEFLEGLVIQRDERRRCLIGEGRG